MIKKMMNIDKKNVVWQYKNINQNIINNEDIYKKTINPCI